MVSSRLTISLFPPPAGGTTADGDGAGGGGNEVVSTGGKLNSGEDSGGNVSSKPIGKSLEKSGVSSGVDFFRSLPMAHTNKASPIRIIPIDIAIAGSWRLNF